jgi:hypothetical protein
MRKSFAVKTTTKNIFCFGRTWAMNNFNLGDVLVRDKKKGLITLTKDVPSEPKADIQQEEPSGLIMLDTVTPEPVTWLWEGHIPLGKLTLVDGDPGLGKSHLCLDLVARISRGFSMPDGSEAPRGGAVLLTLEDGLADTIVPRLKVVGADLSRILAIQSVSGKEGKPRFPTIEDVDAIAGACRKVEAKIVVIDPLMAHLHERTNSFRDQDVRTALATLAEMAEKTDVAVLIVRHLNKSNGGQSIYRGGGSIGIIGASRCAFLVAKDPENESRRVLAGIKNNLAPLPPSLTFTIEGVKNSSRLVWGGVSQHSADALLAIPSSAEERSVLDEAKDFLRDLLSGGAVEAKKAQMEARKAGIAEKTLQRAKKALGVKAEKEGFTGGWAWSLSPEDGQDTSKVVIKNYGHLRGDMTTFDENGEDDDLQEVLI